MFARVCFGPKVVLCLASKLMFTFECVSCACDSLVGPLSDVDITRSITHHPISADLTVSVQPDSVSLVLHSQTFRLTAEASEFMEAFIGLGPPMRSFE